MRQLLLLLLLLVLLLLLLVLLMRRLGLRLYLRRRKLSMKLRFAPAGIVQARAHSTERTPTTAALLRSRARSGARTASSSGARMRPGSRPAAKACTWCANDQALCIGLRKSLKSSRCVTVCSPDTIGVGVTVEPAAGRQARQRFRHQRAAPLRAHPLAALGTWLPSGEFGLLEPRDAGGGGAEVPGGRHGAV